MPRYLKYILIGFGSLALTGCIAVALYVFWITRDLPGYASLEHYEPPVTTRVYAGNGTLIGEYARERRIFVPIAFIPPLVREAFISAEDKNFYSHPGIDIFGILRASINNVSNAMEDRRLQGASTITQQVAKNFLLNSEVKVSRKVREAILAMRIDNAFSKDQILELYLNEIFLGENSYGVAAAALNYFGKSLDELTPAEAAFLGALPKAPSNYSPTRHKAAAVARRNWVLDQMVDNGYITRADAEAAKASDLVTQTRAIGAVAPDVDYFVEEVRRFLYSKYGEQALYDGGLQVRSTLDTHYQDIAVRSLRAGLIAYDRRHGWRGAVAQIDPAGYWQAALARVPNRSGVATWRLALVTATTPTEADIAFPDGSKGVMPLSEMKWARKQIKTWLGPEVTKPADVVKAGDVVYVEPVTVTPPTPAKPDAKVADAKTLTPVVATSGPSNTFGLRQLPAVNGAIVAMDPFTGHVLALSGGFSYGSSEFDRATQAQRQPGSTFKPMVYATALDHGYTPISKVLDGPFAVEQGPGLPLWTPENYEAGEYLGMTTLRRGVEESRNVMTARLAHDLGMESVAQTAERMGLYDHLPRLLAMSLGAGETTLLRLTTVYSEFVNGGRKLEPTLIDRVQDRHGKTVYRFDMRDCPDCAQDSWRGQEEPLLDENRPQVLDPRTAYQIVSILEGVVQRGTGVVVKEVGKPLAGKTGTSSDFHDTWFVGFSPDLALGVFVGFDNPQSLGNGEAGAQTAAPIFRDFMKEALANQPATPFRIPSGIVLVPVDAKTGTPEPAGTPGTILEAFKPGTEPGAESADALLPGASNADGTIVPASAGSAPANPPADAVNTQIGNGTGGLY
jgi:penicillin-binding protein 1A